MVHMNSSKMHLGKKKDEPLALLNHDIKSLLTSIKSYTQLIQRKTIGQTAVAAYISRLDLQVDKLTTLVVKMLDAKSTKKK